MRGDKAWNYRVFRHRETESMGKPFQYYTIHEIHYNQNRRAIQYVNAEPLHPEASTMSGLRRNLSDLKKAFDKPLLEWSDYEKEAR